MRQRAKQRGLTLIELMVVIAIIAILASIAIPNLIASKERSHEIAAVATLRTLVTVQAQFKQTLKVDIDGDGDGEYGGFLELSGAAAGRMVLPLVPGMVSPTFRTLTDQREVVRSGYVFRIFLAAPNGEAISEEADGTWTGIDTSYAEVLWCAYAWPLDAARTGSRTFFANQSGLILATQDPRYSGLGACPEDITSGAAFAAAGIDSVPARGVVGQDGNKWNEIPW